MEGILRRVDILTRNDQLTWEGSEITQELKELRQQLRNLEDCYDMTDDMDMIESLIYQMNGLRVRYGYLLKQARLRGVRAPIEMG